MKSPELLVVFAPTVTEILPVEALAGTIAVSCVVLPELSVAVMPLNLTVLELSVELKLVPEIVTEVPTMPLEGVKLEIVGVVGGAVTVARVNVT